MSEANPTPATPAIGYSITSNIGANSQAVFQCFVAEDEDDSKVNAKLDRIMGFVDRLTARGQLPDLKEQLEKHLVAIAQMTEDKARLDLDFERSQAALDVQAGELRAQATQINNDGAEYFRASGRQGEYKPSGQVQASINRTNSTIDAIAAEKEKNIAERDAALANYTVTEKRFLEERDRLQAKVDEAEAKIRDS